MLSFHSIDAGADAAGAAQYYEDLAREDYYTAGGEPPGKWVGKFAQALNLDGQQVQKGQLIEAFSGFDPATGKPIAHNAGPAHKPGYDLTFSAPKSVSIIWATADQATRQAISSAQQKAVEAAIAHAEKIGAFVQRAGHGGIEKIPHGELLVATFEHSTSRNGDAQLHTHAITPNLAANGKTVDFDSRHKMELGAYYRAHLASTLREMGYSIERDRASFRITGVPDALTREQSGRSQEIAEYLSKMGIDPNSKAGAAFKMDTRQAKGEVDRAEIFSRAREAAGRHDFDPAAIRSGQEELKLWNDQEFTVEAFGQASTLTATQLRAAGFVYSQDKDANPETHIQRMVESGELVELIDTKTGDPRWTSREMLEIERGLGDAAKRLSAVRLEQDDERLAELSQRHKLSTEQADAFRHLTARSYAAVQGVAGAGKSRMVGAARELWESQGKRVIATAIAAKAARGLADGAGIKESSTLDGLLLKLENEAEKLDKNTIIVLDEAGMVGSRKMARLLLAVEQSGAQLKLIGDPRQLQPIDAGGAFRTMISEAGAAQINTVQRQQSAADRRIVSDLAEGRTAQALDSMREANMIHAHEDAEAARREVAAQTIADLATGKSAIVMTGTRREAFQVNQLARGMARTTGQITGPDVSFKNAAGDWRHMAQGERAMFTQNDKRLHIDNGMTGTIQKIEDGKMTVALDEKGMGDGRVVEINLADYAHIEHGYAYTTHKSQGVTVDRARALVDEKMLDMAMGYVQASRHREKFDLHGTREQIEDLDKLMARERLKDTSADHTLKNEPPKPGLLAKAAAGARLAAQNVAQAMTAEPAATRLQPVSRTVQHDADLARQALTSHRMGARLPTREKIDEALRQGRASFDRDSKGRTYLKMGSWTLAYDLNKSTKVRNRFTTLTGEHVAVVPRKGLAGKFGATVVLQGRPTISGKLKGMLDGKQHLEWRKAGVVRTAVTRLRQAAGWGMGVVLQQKALADLRAQARGERAGRQPARSPRQAVTELQQSKPVQQPSRDLSLQEIHAVMRAGQKLAGRSPGLHGSVADGHARHIQALLDEAATLRERGMSGHEELTKQAGNEARELLEIPGVRDQYRRELLAQMGAPERLEIEVNLPQPKPAAPSRKRGGMEMGG
ncbi:putative Conjugative relaxase domain protein [Thiomonas sp. X19]|uniref:MobF family relaxase n=1 Tax=Thiomonas sp. X19 TaxID=1050370 RepID=UPI000B6310D9|nr:MobF family relaxase [Thiomonas sp. X19]SCC95170.1 putative Conjugative relaxase domain protein [Thiomonas sp. X19]